jgi:hypothetical protein
MSNLKFLECWFLLAKFAHMIVLFLMQGISDAAAALQAVGTN